VIALLNALHQPLSKNSKRRAAARAEWYSVMDQPLLVHGVIGENPLPIASRTEGRHL